MKKEKPRCSFDSRHSPGHYRIYRFGLSVFHVSQLVNKHIVGPKAKLARKRIRKTGKVFHFPPQPLMMILMSMPSACAAKEGTCGVGEHLW
jgi:hypothetical protein